MIWRAVKRDRGTEVSLRKQAHHVATRQTIYVVCLK